MLKLFPRTTPAPIRLTPVRHGIVRGCETGLVRVSGLAVPVGSLCRIAQGGTGPDGGPGKELGAEVIGFRDGQTLMLPMGDSALLQPGARVRVDGDPGMVRVGDAFLGRAVDGEGCPIDGGGPIGPAPLWPAHGVRTGALERSSVREPFDCGIRALNAVATFGRGQRIGIMAGSGVGKSVLIDMIAQGNDAEIVIFALVGERAREVSGFVERHMTGAARMRTAVVAVPADHAPNLRLRGAMLATAMAEHFRAQGARVLLVMDSLTRIAHAAREIGLLLGEPGAARGYPPSALATITRLVERAGNAASTGGSITGLYSVLADGDDANDPVVDTARSILDGHVVLSRDLAQRGQYPAIDISASLSRVMHDVCSPAHVTGARELRRLYAALEANRDLVMMGAYRVGSDAQLDRALAMEEAIAAFLAQEMDEAVTLEASVAAMERLLGG